LLEALPAVMWFIRRHMRRHRAKGLSVPQFRVLVLLRQYPAATLSLVAEQLGSTMPTASRIVTGLVGRGLIARKGCRDDRRQIRLELTAKGNAVLDFALEATRAVVAEKLSGLDAEQRVVLGRAMEILSRIFTHDPKTCSTDASADA
jgi:DNA-binding MarR family transcriptional regulator